MENLFKLLNQKPANIFSVPEGYFDTFSERLRARMAGREISDTELNETLPLADYTVLDDLDKKIIFGVPQDYFSSLPARIESRIKNTTVRVEIDFSEVDAAFQNDLQANIFSVPEGYFDSLADRIINKVSETGKPEEIDFSALEETSELGILSGLPKQNIFKTPENYFDGLADKIITQAEKPETENQSSALSTSADKTKSVRLMPAWLRYGASVAAVVLLTFTGIFFYQSHEKSVAATPCTDRLLCDVSDAELMQYFEQNKLHDEVLMEMEKEDSKQIHQAEDTPKNIELSDEELLEEIDM
jgi:hypothetical protein